MTKADELAKLAKLREEGVLTDEEFQQQKQTLLAGADAAPAIASTNTGKKRNAGKGCLAVIVVLVLLGIVGAILDGGKNGSGGADKKEAAVAPTAVTATELYDAYHANEPAAQNAYGERPLLVSGTVDSVDLDFKGAAVVNLKTPNEFQSAQAELTDAAKPQASGISKGQSIKLLCQSVQLIIGTPMLSGCEPQ